MKNSELKILKDNSGKILFVGTMRQIKRRLKKMFRAGPLPYLLFEAGQHGLNIAPGDLLLEQAKRYNKFMDKLKAKLKELPKEPGVYQFKDKDGAVLYVGKAKNLKARVSQYFNKTDERPQIPYLLAEAADLDYTVVTNELESLFLENTLIKEYMPRYNIQLRDDKNYAFIKINYGTEIPQIEIARKVGGSEKFQILNDKFQINSKVQNSKSKDKYFGPYSAAWKIRNTLNLVRRIFPYCSNKEVGQRPCFYYYLHRCPGVCIGKISLEEYRRHLSRIEKFLTGDTAEVKREVAAEMKTASRQEKFEQAARLRDQLQALELLDERQVAILAKPVDWDIVSIFSEDGFSCINLFKIRQGKMQDKENFVFESDANTRIHANDANVLQTFLEQYYLEASSAPKEIYLQIPAEDTHTIEKLLKNRFGKKISVSVPKRGKQPELINLGTKNAEEHLKNWLQSQAIHLDRIQGALNQLKEVLGLEKIPERIECYDISNIQGTNAVGSMVVFKNGVPAKSEYRKFKIKGKSTPDDFAMMREMLTRRLARIFNSQFSIFNETAAWPTPDLIVIDGGKGQLNAALEVLQKFPIPNSQFQIPIIGLAKRIEEIFLPGQQEPIVLPHDNSALQMLQRIRDEAHRFGITFHRELRSKTAVRSALDSIPGIGPKFKKLLKQNFGTVSRIRTASVEELSKIVGQKLAEKLKNLL